MWKVKGLPISRHGVAFVIFDDGEYHSEGERVYSTPYRIEAQQIADELNGVDNASN